MEACQSHCQVKQSLEDYIKTPTVLQITRAGEVFCFNPHVMGIARHDNAWYAEGNRTQLVDGAWQDGEWIQLPTAQLQVVPLTDQPQPGLSQHFQPQTYRPYYRRLGFAMRKEGVEAV